MRRASKLRKTNRILGEKEQMRGPLRETEQQIKKQLYKGSEEERKERDTGIV